MYKIRYAIRKRSQEIAYGVESTPITIDRTAQAKKIGKLSFKFSVALWIRITWLGTFGLLFISLLTLEKSLLIL